MRIWKAYPTPLPSSLEFPCPCSLTKHIPQMFKIHLMYLATGRPSGCPIHTLWKLFTTSQLHQLSTLTDCLVSSLMFSLCSPHPPFLVKSVCFSLCVVLSTFHWHKLHDPPAFTEESDNSLTWGTVEEGRSEAGPQICFQSVTRKAS